MPMATQRMSAVRIDPAASSDDVARLRVPPHSREAEQSVLGALLLDGHAAWPAVSGVVTEADFYAFEHRQIFSVAAGLLAAGDLADPITVLERLQAIGRADDCGGLPYLTSLSMSVPGTSGAKNYAQIVRERAIRRRLIAASDEIATAAFNPGAVNLPALLAGAEEKVRAVAAMTEQQAAEFPMLSMDDLDAMPDQEWLVHNVIPANSVGVIFGGSGSYKSFLMLDLSLRLAYGMPWLGRETKQGSVLVIVGEGSPGTKKRVKAWRQAHGKLHEPAPLHVLPVAVDILADASRVADAAHAAKITPALVIVDTLSQTFTGEENSANEVAAYLRELGLMFRQVWQAAVCVIHHSGHQATERPRGSSALRANVDWMFGVFRDQDEMLATVECAKQKDGEKFADISFRLSEMVLDSDEDGDPIKSLVAWHMSTTEEVQEAMSA